MFERMSDYKLNASKREVTGSAVEELRLAGNIPAVVYGKGKENLNLVVNKIEFNKVFSKSGENSLIDLEVDGKVKNVLAKEVQFHGITDEPMHIDFYEVKMDEEIETEVPLKFVGESPAVKDLEGTFITNKTAVEVKCLPANIPHEIEIDISVIATFEDSIQAKDIKLPSTVELLTDPEETIALVNPPRSEEELEELNAEVVENVEAVEVTAEKKEEEGAEGAAEEKKEEKAE
jgi:large subunit ribosomal protein L25